MHDFKIRQTLQKNDQQPALYTEFQLRVIKDSWFPSVEIQRKSLAKFIDMIMEIWVLQLEGLSSSVLPQRNLHSRKHKRLAQSCPNSQWQTQIQNFHLLTQNLILFPKPQVNQIYAFAFRNGSIFNTEKYIITREKNAI